MHSREGLPPGGRGQTRVSSSNGDRSRPRSRERKGATGVMNCRASGRVSTGSGLSQVFARLKNVYCWPRGTRRVCALRNQDNEDSRGGCWNLRCRFEMKIDIRAEGNGRGNRGREMLAIDLAINVLDLSARIILARVGTRINSIWKWIFTLSNSP